MQLHPSKGEDVAALIGDVYEAVCSITPNSRSFTIESVVNYNDPKVYLIPAAGRYLDVHGELPQWAKSTLSN
jgi:hypothetical protein